MATDGRYSLLSSNSHRSQPLSTMDRLRRSFRDSFRRRKKDRIPESSKPHQWQSDEMAVRSGDCSFHVKYLGCVEVFDSRGMNICEEALKLLRNTSRRRPVKGILYVTGDGLRVVDDETKGLIVDQTIEKVSFCAPDRNYEKGFSYICRDGTTRRWMCHGFQAKHDSGERLSHAVGCAFAVCLERKQKRDKDVVSVTMNFDTKNSTFTRNGSFRQSTITERLKDPQFVKPTEPPPVKQVYNPFAIDRPHATVQTLERQGSFRGFSHLSSASPFKRQLSLRLNDLPSNLARSRLPSAPNPLPGHVTSHSLMQSNGTIKSTIPSLPNRPNSNRIDPIVTNGHGSSVAFEGTSLPVQHVQEDTISEMCKELSLGLQLLSSSDAPFTPVLTSPTLEANSSSFDTMAIVHGTSSIPSRTEVFSPNLSDASSLSSNDGGSQWQNSFTNRARLAPTPSSSFDAGIPLNASLPTSPIFSPNATTNVTNSNSATPTTSDLKVSTTFQQHNSSIVSNGTTNCSTTSSWVNLESPVRTNGYPQSQSQQQQVNTSNNSSPIKPVSGHFSPPQQPIIGGIRRVTKTTLPTNPPLKTTTTIIVRDPFDAEWAALSTPSVPLPVLSPTIPIPILSNGQSFNTSQTTSETTDLFSDHFDINNLSPTKQPMVSNNRTINSVDANNTNTNPFLTTSNNISKAFEVQM